MGLSLLMAVLALTAVCSSWCLLTAVSWAVGRSSLAVMCSATAACDHCTSLLSNLVAHDLVSQGCVKVSTVASAPVL